MKQNEIADSTRLVVYCWMPRRKKALPALPHSIDSLLGPVEVHIVENLDNGKCLGRFLTNVRLIELEKQQTHKQMWQTLYHEWVHVVLWDSGCQLKLKDEEYVCDVIAMWRVRELIEAFENN